MAVLLRASVIATAAACAGCSTYPLPQDVTASKTRDIVSNIRCQARAAVRRAALIELNGRLKDRPTINNFSGSALAADLEAHPKKWLELKRAQFTGKDARDVVRYYGTTAVTYEFTLQGTEENLQGASVDLLRKFLRRADTIGVGVSADRTRDVKRVFTMQDSFWHLATQIRDDYCDREPAFNIIYPSQGKMPVADLIDTYVYLNEWGTLDSADKPNFDGTPKGPATRQMADTITFTTELKSVNNPGIAYNPIGQGFGASAAKFTNENSRKDLHKIIVTLTTTDVPDGEGDFRSVTPVSKEEIRATGRESISSVRNKNLQDDISLIARSLSRENALGLR